MESIQFFNAVPINTSYGNEPMTDEPLVLVVENDKLCADLLKHMLSRGGYRVVIAEDGFSAQNRINILAHPPHLVLLELMMPFVDGYQLLQQIHRKPEWAETPVIVLSTKTQEQDIVRAFELRASDYVTKPFQLGELLARIRRQISSRQCHG
jgi:two-component system, OmpR family, alkaline phosphatase synthesis response regulator PhoP